MVEYQGKTGSNWEPVCLKRGELQSKPTNTAAALWTCRHTHLGFIVRVIVRGRFVKRP